MKHHRKGKLAAIFLMALAVLAGTVPVRAATLKDEGSEACAITVKANSDVPFAENSTFHLYQVADLQDDLTTSFTEKFKNSGVKDEDIQPDKLNSMSASELKDLANRLKAIVEEKNISADESRQLNRTGCVTFTGSDDKNKPRLRFGLYLILGDDAIYQHNQLLHYVPILVSLPQETDISGQWSYATTVDLKSEQEAIPVTSVPSEPTGTQENKNTPTPSIKGRTEKTPTTTPGPNRTRGVKTGDMTSVIGYCIVLIAAAGVAIVAWANRKHRNRN